jgi:hypothetical protein
LSVQVALTHVVIAVLVVGLSALMVWARHRRPATGGLTGRKPALVINGESLAATDLESDVDVVYRNVEELAFRIETGQVSITETIHGRELTDFGLVQVASFPRPTGVLVNVIAEYLDRHRVPAANLAGIGVPSRLLQCARFALAGLPVPRTFYLAPRKLADSYAMLADQLELPFMLRSLGAGRRQRSVLVGSESGLRERLREPPSSAMGQLAQQLIPAAETYRLLVLGGDVRLVMRSTWMAAAEPDEPGTGGVTALVSAAELDSTARRVAVAAAGLVGSEVVAIDLVQHWRTSEWYVLGANPSPALASGPFTAAKIGAFRDYLRERLAKTDR